MALSTPPLSPDQLGAALERLRAHEPLVQCLTNVVAANVTANALLAVGASPAMVDNPSEAGQLAPAADAVLVNLGTPYAETTHAMSTAVARAHESGTPWVLDPVAAGNLEWRTTLARDMLDRSPAVVRGNGSEVIALAGADGGGKGVDSTLQADEAAETATELALRHRTAVAVSGRVDHLTDGARLVRLANGHPLLTKVTGAGCALGGLIAAFTGVVADRLVAATTATAVLTVAAEDAAELAAGPGSFGVALMDRLHALTPESLARSVRIR